MLIVLCVSAIVPRTGARPVSFPVLLQRTGKNAIFAADEFFSARGELSRLVRTARDRAAPGLAEHFLPHYLALSS